MALGELHDVLDNADEGGSSTITYTCESVDATTGTATYRQTGTSSGDHTISYNATSGWADVGGGEPRFFGDAVPATATINPGPTVLKLYLINNDWSQLCVLNTDYSSGSGGGINPLSTGGSGTQKKVFCNFW